jgi:hypothetical protein
LIIPGFLPQINNTQQKIINRNLTIKDNINHFTCTQVILDNSSLEKPRRENQCSAFVDVLLETGK